MVAGLEYREALGWQMPGAWWREPAAQALWERGQALRDAGDLQAAVSMWTHLRAGLFASRTMWGGPDAHWRAKVDGALASGLAAWEAQSAAAQGRPSPGTLAEREAHFQGVYARDTMPAAPMSALAVLGFFSWIGLALSATRRSGRARWIRVAGSVLAWCLMLVGVRWA